jgi:hypothetical protein
MMMMMMMIQMCFNTVRKSVIVLWLYHSLRRLFSGLSSRRPGFAHRAVHVGVVMDKAVFSLVGIISPVCHIH